MATTEQIQRWANERTRVRAEQIRALLLAMEDDVAAIGDIYATLNDPGDWTDNRTDGPPTLLDANALLAMNTFVNDMSTAMRASLQLPDVLKACVRPVQL